MITTLWSPRGSPNIVRHAIHLLCGRPALTSLIRVLLRDLHADLSRIHCGSATFSLASEIAEMTTCDCSLCWQKNADDQGARARAHGVGGEDLLPIHEWNTQRAKHFFCSRCAADTFHRVPPRRIISPSTSSVCSFRRARCRCARPRMRACRWSIAMRDANGQARAKPAGAGHSRRRCDKQKRRLGFPKRRFRILTSKEEDFLSFAGLAATYSPRA